MDKTRLERIDGPKTRRQTAQGQSLRGTLHHKHLSGVHPFRPNTPLPSFGCVAGRNGHAHFEHGKGEIFGVLDSNVAEKTTTIRMLTGVIKPDEGTALILGFDILQEGHSGTRELMGIVPEMANAYVDLSAWDNLMLTRELYGVPKNQRVERSYSLLKKFGARYTP